MNREEKDKKLIKLEEKNSENLFVQQNKKINENHYLIIIIIEY